MTTRVAVLVSGGGTNLQALIDAQHSGSADERYRIVGVISNRPNAGGLKRAADAGIAAITIDHKAFGERADFDAALRVELDKLDPDLVVLAGFMRILTPEFVRHFHGRMLNIHPSLLPKYPGLNTHQRALEAGDSEAGATVHFVTEELDGGPAAVQARVPILAGDTPESLAARVLEQEHVIFPQALRWFAAGRLQLRGSEAFFDDQPLPPTGAQIS